MIYQDIKTINGRIIQSLIDKSATRHAEIKSLYDRYKGIVPIKSRIYQIDNIKQTGKINNKIANDFFSEIVDMKVGFFCGVPITYNIRSDEEDNTAQEFLDNYNKENNIADFDLQNAKIATICGYSARLFYYDDVNVRIAQINPWEVIFIGKRYDTPDVSIRYYTTEEIDEQGNWNKIHYADVYDNTYVTRYKRKEKEEEYIAFEVTPHLFPSNPLIGFLNNEEAIGDVERVIELIDGYDKTLSDINSELEQFRLAYLAVYGAQIDSEIIEQAKRTGAFGLPGLNSKIEFITKNLDDNILEHHMDRLERNIYRFSRTPNMNDQAFAGDLSGVAMKYKFRSFEDKCKTAELKFKTSLMSQYKILCAVWASQGIQIDYLDIDYVFTRNYPQNLIEEIDFLNKAKGIITDETAFSNVSFIENPKEEIEALEEQKEEDMEKFLQNTNTDSQIMEPVEDEISKE